MKFKQHIDMGKYILENNIIKTFNVNRAAYLFGNIAPDFNCIYPAHRLNTTEKRFYKRIRKTKKAQTDLIKSYNLGIVTHYICDYFCYAHNIKSLGFIHKKYETNLYKYYKNNIGELNDTLNGIAEIWAKNKSKCKQMCVKDQCFTSDEHNNFIMEQIKLMNNDYMNRSKNSKYCDWTSKTSQIIRDTKYSMFMAEHIITLILEPFKCLVGSF